MIDLKEWKRQRGNLFVNGCIASFLFGLTMHIYMPTEFYYFKHSMKLNDPAFYYGLSWGALCGSAVIFSLVGTYYYDRTSDVRRLVLATTTLSIIGNILYLIYYSPYIVLFGQFLIGMAASRNSALIGEVSQVYETELVSQKISIAAVFSVIGGCIGPVLTYGFKLVHVQIDWWVLDVNNTVGVVMAMLFTLCLIINYFTLKNVSKEHNLKKEMAAEERENLLTKNGVEMTTLEEEEDEEEEKIEEMSFSKRYLLTIRALLRNKEAIFLYWLSFFTSFLRATLLMLMTVKSAFYLNWTPINIATISVAGLVGGALPTAIIFTVMSKVLNDFYLLVIANITLLLALISLLLVPYVSNENFRIAMFYCTAFFTISSGGAFSIVSRAMLAKLVPHNIQGVTDAIRSILFELSYMSAGLALKLSTTYMSEGIIAVIVIVFLCNLWLIVRHRDFKDIKTFNLSI